VHFSVLVNDNSSGFFNNSLDLRQGDPLSSFLFVIVMEALSRMLSATVNGGILSGFFVGSRHSGVVNMSHMLFVDDTLFFYGPKPDHLRYLHALFLCFKAVSSLKINLPKLKLVLVGNVDNLDGWLVVGFLLCF
jgi:hypothetical protein